MKFESLLIICISLLLQLQDKRGLWPSTQRPLEHWPTLAPPNLDDSELQWHPVSDPTSAEPTLDPLPTPTTMGKGYDSVIDDYLAKVDLTVADIEEEDGQLVTTIVDKQGRVLSVTFALSNDKGRELSTIKRRHTTK
ncbi:uncharacterized protein Dere_GG10160 [Drosophila erecta]|uniref:DUF4794 domain-containing protein n=1 Tax=Drosophila erecta TaxID=7220 RepID=B3NA84_DROER|nr:uncharacterized protein Dere_GG10160 [Drosophila erecta]